MDIGVIVGHSGSPADFDHVRKFDLNVCQLSCWNPALSSAETARATARHAADAGVRICAVWGGWSGPAAWNFTRGPVTLGLVPPEYRAQRVEELKRWADFAAELGAPAVVTHCGFIPENLTDPEYEPVCDAIHAVAERCASHGIGFWFETGQETPVVLLRTIQRVGTGNLGINLDPANLILYGKGSPIDALDVFGQYVRNVHVKDGFYPTDGENLGREVPPGQGRVRFPEFIRRLKEIGFTGELVIEREISGEQQERDIRKTVSDLRTWLADA